MIDSRKTKLSLLTRDHFTVQSGTILPGNTDRYPVNSAEISINHPQQVLLIKPISITQDFTIGLTGDWSGKIRSGNSIQLQRGTIDSEYTVKTIKYSNDISIISLSHKRNVVNLLDPYINSNGYNLPAYDTSIQLNRKVESPNNVKLLVKDFSVKLIQDTDPHNFSVKASWILDPVVSAARIRWRSTPRVSSQTNLFFDVLTAGEYKSVPQLNVISTTGRKAEIEMSGYVSTIDILRGGTGYASANIKLIGGGGTGASIVANIVNNSIDSVTINSGGTGYTSFPDIVVTGSSGSTGASLKVNSIVFDKINVIQQGGNYLSPPSIEVDIPDSDILTPANLIAYTDLQNTGRIDYVRVTDGGSGYKNATVSIIGSINSAVAVPVIVDGKITDIKITYPGYGYSNAYVIISSSTGSGARAVANIDLYSKWVYTDINYLDKFVTLNGFNYDIPYEIEILASEDSQFRGLTKYSNLSHFQISKTLLNKNLGYVPFAVFVQSPGIGEEILLEDMEGYSFQLAFNHNVFVVSTGITMILHSYADDTYTEYYIPGGSISGLNSQISNVLNLNFSSYDFIPGDYDITFSGGILNDPAFNYQPGDWYFTVTE